MKLQYLFLYLILVAAFSTRAQQDPMYTQHTFNKLPINAAYAGSRETVSMVALYRNQWTGMPGAPRTCQFNVHAPISKRRIGVGMSLISDRHGISSQTGAWAQFAYHIPTRKGNISLGVSAGATNYRVALATASSAVDYDPSLVSDVNVLLPNAGFGMYYYSERFYIGASAPRLINNDLGQAAAPNAELQGQLKRHYYAMSGYVFDLGEEIKLRPSVLVRYVPNAPVQADFGAAAFIGSRVMAGVQYRSSGSVDFFTEFQLSDWMRLGYAYDLATGSRAISGGGSHEIMLALDLGIGAKRSSAKAATRCYF